MGPTALSPQILEEEPTSQLPEGVPKSTVIVTPYKQTTPGVYTSAKGKAISLPQVAPEDKPSIFPAPVQQGINELRGVIGAGPFDVPFQGLDAINRGASEIGDTFSDTSPLDAAENRAKAQRGAADILEGGLNVGSILIPYAALSAPLKTVAAFGVGFGTQKVVNYLSKKAGMSPDAARLTADVAGFLAGWGATKIDFPSAQKATSPPSGADTTGLDPEKFTDKDWLGRPAQMTYTMGGRDYTLRNFENFIDIRDKAGNRVFGGGPQELRQFQASLRGSAPQETAAPTQPAAEPSATPPQTIPEAQRQLTSPLSSEQAPQPQDLAVRPTGVPNVETAQPVPPVPPGYFPVEPVTAGPNQPVAAPQPQAGTTAAGGIPAEVAPAPPTQVQRYEEPGVPPPDFSKPHGIYTTPANVESPHSDLGGERYIWDRNTEAKTLEIKGGDDPGIVVRRGARNAGAGVWALREMVGPEQFSALKGMSKEDLQEYAKSRFPDVKWDQYYDRQEVMEGLGGMFARAEGFDSIYLSDPDPRFSEYVGLTPKSMTPAAPPPAPVVRQEVIPAQAASAEIAGAAPMAGGSMAQNTIASQSSAQPPAQNIEYHRGPWDISLNANGRQEALDGASQNAGQFTSIISGTLGRHVETAAAYANENPKAGPVQLDSRFNPLATGDAEGSPITPQTVKALNDRMVNAPDEALPGVGQFSGVPGEKPADWSKRLISGVQGVINAWKPGDKTLIVTSGRDTQAIRAFAAEGMPADGHLNPDVLTSEWQSQPGSMMHLDPQTGVVRDVTVADKPGIYIVRHGQTDANNNPAVPAEIAKREALPSVASAPEVTLPGEPQTKALPPQLPPVGEFGSPGTTGDMDPKNISFDPVRFQYKQDVGQRGVSGKLKNVQVWSPAAVGTTKIDTIPGGAAEMGDVLDRQENPDFRMQTVHHLPITQAMRESVMKGQPLFGRQPVSPDQMALFESRAVTTGNLDSPPPRTTAFQCDPSKIERLPEPRIPTGSVPTIAESRTFWDGSAVRMGALGGKRTAFVNTPAMETVLRNVSDVSMGVGADQVLGVPLSAGEVGHLLAEAKAAQAAPQKTWIDKALIRVADQIGDSATPLIVIRASSGLPDATIKRVCEEEFDHAQHMLLPRGTRDLPTEIVESGIGQKAYEHISRAQGYPKLNPASPFYEHARATATSEVIVRLMRPDRWQELGINAQEAGDLAQDIATKLDTAHGERAHAIVEQIYGSIPKDNPALQEGTNGVQSQPAPTAERGPPGETGAERLGDQDVSRVAAEQPTLSARRTASDFLADEEGTSRFMKAAGIERWLQDDIVPALKTGGLRAKSIVQGIVNTLAPTVGVPTDLLDTAFKLKGDRERLQFLLEAALDHMRQALGEKADVAVVSQVAAQRTDLMDALKDSVPNEAERRLRTFEVDVFDRIKTGRQQVNPELQSYADILRRTDDNLFRALSSYKAVSFLANHQRVLWKVLPKPVSAQGVLPLANAQPEPLHSFFGGRRPLRGSQGYMEHHTLDDMTAGILRGGVPVTFNPADMFALHYADVMKYITAQRWWNELETLGARVFVKHAPDAPEDFDKLDDRIASAYFRTNDGFFVQNGEWYVQRGMARMMNNYLSTDPLRQEGTAWGSVGKTMLGAKNFYTAVELGASGFHLTFVTLDAASSEIGLGMGKFVNRGLLEADPRAIVDAGKDIVRGFSMVPSAARAFKIGKAGIEAIKNPTEFLATPEGKWLLKAVPDARDLLADIFTGGAKLDVHHEYIRNAISSFKEAVHTGNYPGAIFRSIPAAQETVMKPLFEWYIPRVKVGVWLREYSAALLRRQNELADGTTTRGEIARQTWASVEDRFGEMNFDNLWWDRRFKTALQIAFRSVTWRLGTARALGRAVGGQTISAVKDIKGGRVPRLTESMSWLLGTSLLIAVIGTVISELCAHKRPESIKDVVFPQIDPHDPTQRTSVNMYPKAYYEMFHSPKDYVESGVSGLVGKGIESLKGRDFYNQMLWSKDDPPWSKILAGLKHMYPRPISWQSFSRMREEGHPWLGVTGAVTGFTKAPGYVSRSAADQFMRDYIDERRGPTPVYTEKQKIISQIVKATRSGDIQKADALAHDAIVSGKVSAKQVNHAQDRAFKDPLYADFQYMERDPSAQIKAITLATPAERAKLLTGFDEKGNYLGVPFLQHINTKMESASQEEGDKWDRELRDAGIVHAP